jgi:hypothetical protein
MPAATYDAVPEKRLLIACARTHMTSSAASQIREIARKPLRWEYLLQTAAENSILPLLAVHLPVVVPEAFTPEQFAHLKTAARAAGIRSLQLSAELIRMLDALRSHDILALPYKGPIIAMQAFGDVALREFEDLDIIVPQRDMARANKAVLALNYQPRSSWLFDSAALIPGEYKYVDAARRLIVELHTELTLRHFPVAPDLDEMAKHATSVAIGGHEVRTFGAEDTLLLLCVHGSKDFWERISWIADVSEFVHRFADLNWRDVFERAQKLKATRMVLLGLALASDLLDTPVPGEVQSRIASDAMAGALANQIAQKLLADDRSVRTAAQSFRYRRQMVPGAVDSWRYVLRLATAPAEEDWTMVRLPRALASLYFVFRPFRLFRKYGMAERKSGA